MAKELVFGKANSGFLIRLNWGHLDNAKSAGDFTIGSISVSFNGYLIWGISDGQKIEGFTWSWIDFLEYLSKTWNRLDLEESDPIGIGLPLSEIRTTAKRLWETESAEKASEQKRLLAFERAHNLARGVEGAVLPAIWIIRQGKEFFVEFDSHQFSGTEAQVLHPLTALGESICNRLADCKDERGQLAIEAWKSRFEIDTNVRLKLLTSLQPQQLRAIEGGEEPESFWKLSKSQEPNELIVVARQSGPQTTPEDVSKVLTEIQKVPLKDDSRVRAIAKRVLAEAGNLGQQKPAVEGQILALALRRILKNNTKPIDPINILEYLGVDVSTISLESYLIDAISIWGKHHGPHVFVNRLGRHSRGVAGRRSTLAHEIYHLLFDRTASLPIAEVLNGRGNPLTEKKANGFAVELLLPRNVAGRAFSKSKDPENTVKSLSQEYGVGKEIIAWQTYESISLSEAQYHCLIKHVRKPQFFLRNRH